MQHHHHRSRRQHDPYSPVLAAAGGIHARAGQRHPKQSGAAAPADRLPPKGYGALLRGRRPPLLGPEGVLSAGLLLPLCAAQPAKGPPSGGHRPRPQSVPLQPLVFLVSQMEFVLRVAASRRVGISNDVFFVSRV